MVWQVAGEFWLGAVDDDLLITTPAGHQLIIGGTLARALKARELEDPVLRVIASRQPMLGELMQALRSEVARPMDRATLLRGTGFHTLFLELTARCNERCTHCYAEAAPERTEMLPLPVLRDLLDDAQRLGFERVQFTGGDPLIVSTLLPAVQHAREVGIPQLEIFTNGLALTDSLLSALVPIAPDFAFSVYSHQPEVHDAVTRVQGSHQRTLSAIRSCLARGLSVRVGSTLFAHTANDRDAIRAQLTAQGVAHDAIGFVMSHNVGRGEFVPGENDLGEHGGGQTSAGAGKACVLADGGIVPCIFSRGTRLGSVYDSRLYDVLTAPVPLDSSSVSSRALDDAATRLSCAECRLRDVLIGRSPPPANLVTLRRART